MTTDKGSQSSSSPLHRAIPVLAVLAVAMLRLDHCLQVPANTTDVTRHLFYGLLVARDGLAAAGAGLQVLDPRLAMVGWSNLAFNYPIVALLFDVAISSTWATIFAYKLALTAVEGLNAWLLARVTGDRWLGILYWALPASIWWVSREGQFEPLQNLFVFAALWMVRRRPVAALLLLALAVQVKLSAVLLLPVLVARVERRQRAAALLAFVLGFLPTVWAQLHFPTLQQTLDSVASLSLNPYYWNPFRRELFVWNRNPLWSQVIDQLASYGLLVLLVVVAKRRRQALPFLAPVGFLLALKLSTLAQFWYVLLWPSFVAPIEDRRLVRVLVGAGIVLNLHAVMQLVFGPSGYVVTGYYKGLGPFVELHL